MGFAACTNEVEEFAPQAQDKEFVGEELGKLTIDVTNSNFSADDAETRATLEKVGNKWIATWGDNDAIGAAWFNRIKTNDGVVTNQASIYDPTFGYGSNAIFNWVEGNTFACDAMCMAGAYVLYYPYNLNATDDLTEIKVKEIESPQTFKTSDVTEQVKANITAANVVSFRKGSQDLSSGFTVKQIPNLYALTFAIEDENLLKLGNTFKISRIYVEATNSGVAAINTDGTVGPEYPGDDYLANLDDKEDAFDYSISPDKWNNVDGEVLPEIDFVGGENKISRMQINVTNDNKETEGKYWIKALGTSTDKFYFSMLPTEDFDKLTIKVVGKMGKETKIFKAEYTTANTTYFDALKDVMMSQGEALTLNVDLNIEVLDNGIYDEEQFYELWKAGQREFEIAEELDFVANPAPKGVKFLEPEVKDAEGNVIADHVIFSGEKVTLPSIKGKYTFTNEVEIKGDATLERCKGEEGCSTQHAFTNKATITGNLNTLGGNKVIVNTPITIGGNVTAEHIKFSKPATIGGNIAVSASAEFTQGVTATGGLTIAENAKVTLGSHASHIVKVANIEAKGDINVKGVVTTGDINIEKKAEFEGTIKEAGNITLASTATANFKCEVVSAGEITANAGVTFNENATVGKVIANKPVTFSKKAVVKGDIDANAVVVINEAEVDGNVNAEAEVEFTTATIKGDVTANADAKLGTAIIEGNLTATDVEVSATKLNVNGTIDLVGEAKLTAPTLTAKTVNVEFYSQLTANTKFDVAETLTAGGKVTANAESTIGVLNIDPNVIVDLHNAKITELNVYDKLTYFGTLNATQLEVKEGTNKGVINATNCTITGEYNQNAILNAAITVAKDAEKNINGILNVNTDMTAANITNNGTVNVAAEKTLSGKVINNATIYVAGKMIENADNEFTTVATSYIKVENTGNLEFVADNLRLGTIEIMQDSKFKNINNADVKFEWTATNVPNETAHNAVVDRVYINGATYKDPSQRAFFKDKDVYLNGDFTLDFKETVKDFAKAAGKLVVEKNSTLKSTYPLTLVLPNETHEIKAGVTFKTVKVTLDADPLNPATITAGKGSTFDGEKTTNVTITQ